MPETLKTLRGFHQILLLVCVTILVTANSFDSSTGFDSAIQELDVLSENLNEPRVREVVGYSASDDIGTMRLKLSKRGSP